MLNPVSVAGSVVRACVVSKQWVFGAAVHLFMACFHPMHCAESRRWRTMVSEGDAPGKRFGYVSVTHGHVMLLFGGYDGASWMNDLHGFNFVTGHWSRLEQHGTLPSNRSCPSWTKHGDAVFVFGGYDGAQRMNDLFQLNLSAFVFCVMDWRDCGSRPTFTRAPVWCRHADVDRNRGQGRAAQSTLLSLLRLPRRVRGVNQQPLLSHFAAAWLRVSRCACACVCVPVQVLLRVWRVQRLRAPQRLL